MNGTCCDKPTLSLKGSIFPYPYYRFHPYLFLSIHDSYVYGHICGNHTGMHLAFCIYADEMQPEVCGVDTSGCIIPSSNEWDLQAITISLVCLGRFRIPCMIGISFYSSLSVVTKVEKSSTPFRVGYRLSYAISAVFDPALRRSLFGKMACAKALKEERFFDGVQSFLPVFSAKSFWLQCTRSRKQWVEISP